MIDTTGRSHAETLRAEAAAFERDWAASKRLLVAGVLLAEVVARLVERRLVGRGGRFVSAVEVERIDDVRGWPLSLVRGEKR